MILTERQLEHLWPELPWREPLKVGLISTPGAVKWACRFCICMNGLKGSQVEKLSADHAVVTAHIASAHGVSSQKEQRS